MTKPKAERASILTAGIVITVLTGAAFWLSYAHLATVAQSHGLARSPERRWAWPATLDLFILAGEVLMFRAALRRHRDGWAIGLTVAGSIGSISLNVAGVGTRAPFLDYVVAAVPPSAALLAFGALMRQVHSFVTDDGPVPEVEPEPAPLPAEAEVPRIQVERAEAPAPVPDIEPEPEPEPTPVAAAPPVPEIDAGVPQALIDHAQKVADAHRTRTGGPIDAPTLSARLGVPAPLAGRIAAQLV